MTKAQMLHRSLKYWHGQVRECGRAGYHHGVQRAVANVQGLELRLGLPLAYSQDGKPIWESD